MSDYISRADAVKTVIRMCSPICEWQDGTQQYPDCVVAEINKLPSADAVEVVRCGECKHMIADGRCMEFADDGIRPSASDFCSYGERKRR